MANEHLKDTMSSFKNWQVADTLLSAHNKELKAMERELAQIPSELLHLNIAALFGLLLIPERKKLLEAVKQDQAERSEHKKALQEALQREGGNYYQLNAVAYSPIPVRFLGTNQQNMMGLHWAEEIEGVTLRFNHSVPDYDVWVSPSSKKAGATLQFETHLWSQAVNIYPNSKGTIPMAAQSYGYMVKAPEKQMQLRRLV